MLEAISGMDRAYTDKLDNLYQTLSQDRGGSLCSETSCFRNLMTGNLFNPWKNDSSRQGLKDGHRRSTRGISS